MSLNVSFCLFLFFCQMRDWMEIQKQLCLITCLKNNTFLQRHNKIQRPNTRIQSFVSKPEGTTASQREPEGGRGLSKGNLREPSESKREQRGPKGADWDQGARGKKREPGERKQTKAEETKGTKNNLRKPVREPKGRGSLRGKTKRRPKEPGRRHQHTETHS